MGREHTLLGQRGTPVVIDLAPATGEVRSVRWRPLGGDVTLAGDLALFEWYEETVVVDLMLEGAAIREVETLEADVERSIAQLSAGHVMNPPSLEYPTGPQEAGTWLRRILPLARPYLLSRVSRAPLGEALALLELLAYDDNANSRGTIAAMINRSFGADPNLEVAALRASAAHALPVPLAPALATRLSAETIDWIDWLARHGGIGRVCDETGEPTPCVLDRATWIAIGAARDALDSGSFDPAPAEAVHARLAALGAHAAPPLSCTPTEEDLARSAALRTLVEFAATPANLHVEPPGCIDVVGISGRATHDASRPVWSLADAASDAPLRVGDPRWDQAPRRTYEWSWYAGPLEAQGGFVVVARVNGTWRTLAVVAQWVS